MGLNPGREELCSLMMQASQDQPLISCIALHRRNFQFYIAQDAHFLTAFHSAYVEAIQKASTLNDKSISSQLQTLKDGVAIELEMHDSYAKVGQICEISVDAQVQRTAVLCTRHKHHISHCNQWAALSLNAISEFRCECECQSGYAAEAYALMQEWGVELAAMLTPSEATQAYVDFLGHVAQTEVPSTVHLFEDSNSIQLSCHPIISSENILEHFVSSLGTLHVHGRLNIGT